MIRKMREDDWDSMVSIYCQSLQKGDVTFEAECPSYAEWDAGHKKNAGSSVK